LAEALVYIGAPFLLITKMTDSSGSAKRELFPDQLSASAASLLVGEVDVVTDQNVCVLHDYDK